MSLLNTKRLRSLVNLTIIRIIYLYSYIYKLVLLLLLVLLPMPNVYRTSILYKSRSKTVLELGKNLYTTTCTYTIITLLRR
jgi:hypothetical protein